jgi:hypothetical protein
MGFVGICPCTYALAYENSQNGVILEVISSPALVLHPVFLLIPTLLLSKKSQKYLTKHQNS